MGSDGGGGGADIRGGWVVVRYDCEGRRQISGRVSVEVVVRSDGREKGDRYHGG